MSSLSSAKRLAYSYVRMSTDVQLKGDSLRRQKELSERYASEQGFTLVEDFKLHDIGVSAFKGANRTTGALGKFLEAVRAKKVPAGSYLLVESLDRMSREDVMTALAPFLELINHDITIVTLGDGQVYQKGRTADFQLILSIFVMSRAHEESRTKSHRVAAAWQNKRANIDAKKLTSRCPAWLELSPDKKSFRLIDDRVRVVETIFQESAEGIGNYSIARRLNKKGIPTFGKSKGWQTSSIGKILAGRAVIGEFQPCRLLGGERVPDGAATPDYFPVVVSEELFYRAQNARAQRRVGSKKSIGGAGRKGLFVSNLFSRIAKCIYCDSPMHHVNKGKGPKGGAYLVCDRARRGLGCEKTGWRYSQFEASFLAFVQELDLEPLVRSEDEQLKRATLDESISALEGRIVVLEQDRERIFGLLSKTGSDFVAAKLQQCETELSTKKAELASRVDQRRNLRSDVSRFYESKDQIKALVERLSHQGDDEVYRLRAQIASRLASLISALYVASAGESPWAQTAREMTAGFSEQMAEIKQRIDVEEWSVEPDSRRYFVIRFKDGSMRSVYPDAEDPLKFQEQLVSFAGGLHRLSADGTTAELIPNQRGSKLFANLPAPHARSS